MDVMESLEILWELNTPIESWAGCCQSCSSNWARQRHYKWGQKDKTRLDSITSYNVGVDVGGHTRGSYITTGRYHHPLAATIHAFGTSWSKPLPWVRPSRQLTYWPSELQTNPWGSASNNNEQISLQPDCIHNNQKNQQMNLQADCSGNLVWWTGSIRTLAAPHLKRKCHCNFQPHAVETIVAVLAWKETWFVRYMLAGQETQLHEVDTPWKQKEEKMLQKC